MICICRGGSRNYRPGLGLRPTNKKELTTFFSPQLIYRGGIIAYSKGSYTNSQCVCVCVCVCVWEGVSKFFHGVGIVVLMAIAYSKRNL